jgi:hypothetical protein
VNIKLKGKIIENYGHQWKFAAKVDMAESVVSKIINRRRELSVEDKRIWAKALKCKVSDIF